MADQVPVPKTIGRYQVLGTIGVGAMGAVYKAFDPLIKRTLAIKTIRLDIPRGSPEYKQFLDRFYHEARISGTLSHPNIVTLFDIGEDSSGAPYLAMEYIEGETLESMVERGVRFRAEKTIALVSQVAAALDYAHQRGVVHRDIKPSNLILFESERVKVMDFGIAKLAGSELTQAGQLLGTPSYMSPEQAMGERLDGRSDIFSLGVVAFEMMSGDQPFPGNNVTSILYRLVHMPPVEPANLEMHGLLPQKWHEVYGKALAKKPDQRYQTAAEFVQDLELCLGSWFAAIPGEMDPGERTVLDRHAFTEPVPVVPSESGAVPPPVSLALPEALEEGHTNQSTAELRMRTTPRAPAAPPSSPAAPPPPPVGTSTGSRAPAPATHESTAPMPVAPSFESSVPVSRRTAASVPAAPAAPLPVPEPGPFESTLPLPPAKAETRAHRPPPAPPVAPPPVAPARPLDDDIERTVVGHGPPGMDEEAAESTVAMGPAEARAAFFPAPTTDRMAPEVEPAAAAEATVLMPARPEPQSEEGATMVVPSAQLPSARARSAQLPPTPASEKTTAMPVAGGPVAAATRQPLPPPSVVAPTVRQPSPLPAASAPTVRQPLPPPPVSAPTVRQAVPPPPVPTPAPRSSASTPSGPPLRSPSGAVRAVEQAPPARSAARTLVLAAAAGFFLVAVGLAALLVLRQRHATAVATPTPEATLPSLTRGLSVESEPSGATVRVNGEVRGTTPLRLPDLGPGLYTIEAELAGYEGSTHNVALTESAPVHQLKLTLEKALVSATTGSLDVVSKPAGAQVEVDGVAVGTTPLKGFRIPPGSHAIVVSAPDCESQKRKLDFEAGQTQKLDLKLKSTKVFELNDLDEREDGDPPSKRLKRLSGERPPFPRFTGSGEPPSVLAEITVGEDGRVSSVQVLESGGDKPDQAVTKTVKGWRYAPGLKDGELVRFRYRVRFRAPTQK